MANNQQSCRTSFIIGIEIAVAGLGASRRAAGTEVEEWCLRFATWGGGVGVERCETGKREWGEFGGGSGKGIWWLGKGFGNKLCWLGMRRWEDDWGNISPALNEYR